jgi:threonine/homoserine/homoserine lactone efflux protein
MTYLQSLLVLTGVLAVSMISPGPNFAIVTSAAINLSRRAGIVTGLGLAAASATWTALVLGGLGLIIVHVGWLYTAIRLVGAVYLIWIGARMVWEARAPFRAARSMTPARGWATWRKAYFVSMTNPKSAAFYGSILAVMIPAHAPGWFYAAIILIATGLSALWYCGVAILLSTAPARRSFAKGKPVLETVMGVFLVGIGGRMLMD